MSVRGSIIRSSLKRLQESRISKCHLGNYAADSDTAPDTQNKKIFPGNILLSESCMNHSMYDQFNTRISFHLMHTRVRSVASVPPETESKSFWEC